MKYVSEELLNDISKKKGKKLCDGNYSDACASCGLFTKE